MSPRLCYRRAFRTTVWKMLFGSLSFTMVGVADLPGQDDGNGAKATTTSRIEKTKSEGSTAASTFGAYTLDFNTPVNPALQKELEDFDTELRQTHGMDRTQTAVGLLDLRTLRLAMINPDRGEYAASIPKIGILLAYFQLHPEAATNLDVRVRHELGMMTKSSNNDMAAIYSFEMGLTNIQKVLNDHGLYDEKHGGGLWMGKHYGRGSERIGDPVGDNSHAATVRQLLRFYLWLEQGKLVSPQASRVMREIFATPEIPHDKVKFVKALAGREVQIIRKWGNWKTWAHDSAVITGTNRHYILVALTNHPKGDSYLMDLATRVDDLMKAGQ